ncbi:hypothetical protein BWQ96_08606 [Gracilariopsis chorda]|uniref:Transmembrane protein n=1 Tax=Gracilariopsis chorda TaxID=448386 RepID=A0A2V3IHV1_9FLOR|nr:hypothetical protein BWQ96_08606 [Gracilariopsis chorda]|eukprot:PXF41685.1 hypothetical protein BWQ96_08606 [Gracilariopsis chorda]
MLQRDSKVDGSGLQLGCCATLVVNERKMRIRASTLGMLQAVTISVTTMASVLLVVGLRPNRKRFIPFYSDASHNEPERSVLSLGENAALVFGTLTQTAEYEWLRALAKRSGNENMRVFVKMYGWCGAVAMTCWFVTANVPTVRPVIEVHQLGASLLMVALAGQGSLKWWMVGRLHGAFGTGGRGWIRWQRTVRAGVAGVLWMAVFGTWICFVGRRRFGIMALVKVMTAFVYAGTVAAISLMVLTAVDVKGQWVELLVDAE